MEFTMLEHLYVTEVCPGVQCPSVTNETHGNMEEADTTLTALSDMTKRATSLITFPLQYVINWIQKEYGFSAGRPSLCLDLQQETDASDVTSGFSADGIHDDHWVPLWDAGDMLLGGKAEGGQK